MTGRRPRVVLLRTPDDAQDEGQDRYVRALWHAGFSAVCVPVLQFESLRPARLREALSEPDRWAGLVVTSPQGARELVEVPEMHGWRAPVWCVGAQTASVLAQAGLQGRGSEAGTAAALAAHVLRDRDSDETRPLLFVAGDRRRADLPEALAAAGVPVEEITAYRTVPRPSPLWPDGLEADWLAFFSPSGVEAAFRDPDVPRGARRAAIGPTTAEALKGARLPPDAVATEPAPEALATAIAHAHEAASS